MLWREVNYIGSHSSFRFFSHLLHCSYSWGTVNKMTSIVSQPGSVFGKWCCLSLIQMFLLLIWSVWHLGKWFDLFNVWLCISHHITYQRSTQSYVLFLFLKHWGKIKNKGLNHLPLTVNDVYQQWLILPERKDIFCMFSGKRIIKLYFI